MADYTPIIGSPTGPTTTTSTNATLYSIEQVQSTATLAFQNALGRRPTNEELQAFLDTINGARKSTTTTTQPDGSSSSTTTGGVDPAQVAQNMAEANPEYAGYQKATTYFDAMLSALNGPVGGSI